MLEKRWQKGKFFRRQKFALLLKKTQKSIHSTALRIDGERSRTINDVRGRKFLNKINFTTNNR